MKPPRFAYHAPASVDEAVALLERYGGEARVLAGGQSLVPMLNFRLITPAALIDLADGFVLPDDDAATLAQVIAAAVAAGLVSVPGFFTPTEAFTAIGAGAHALKFFPAEAGSPAVLKAMFSVPADRLAETANIDRRSSVSPSMR
jgi:hypothetical protein